MRATLLFSVVAAVAGCSFDATQPSGAFHPLVRPLARPREPQPLGPGDARATSDLVAPVSAPDASTVSPDATIVLPDALVASPDMEIISPPDAVVVASLDVVAPRLPDAELVRLDVGVDIAPLVPDAGAPVDPRVRAPDSQAMPDVASISCIQQAINNGYASTRTSCAQCLSEIQDAGLANSWRLSDCTGIIDCLAASWPIKECTWRNCWAKGIWGGTAQAALCLRDILQPGCGNFPGAIWDSTHPAPLCALDAS